MSFRRAPPEPIWRQIVNLFRRVRGVTSEIKQNAQAEAEESQRRVEQMDKFAEIAEAQQAQLEDQMKKLVERSANVMEETAKKNKVELQNMARMFSVDSMKSGVRKKLEGAKEEVNSGGTGYSPEDYVTMEELLKKPSNNTSTEEILQKMDSLTHVGEMLKKNSMKMDMKDLRKSTVSCREELIGEIQSLKARLKSKSAESAGAAGALVLRSLADVERTLGDPECREEYWKEAALLVTNIQHEVGRLVQWEEETPEDQKVMVKEKANMLTEPAAQAMVDRVDMDTQRIEAMRNAMKEMMPEGAEEDEDHARIERSAKLMNSLPRAVLEEISAELESRMGTKRVDPKEAMEMFHRIVEERALDDELEARKAK